MQVAPLRAACPPTARFVMVTATLAASVFAQLTQEFPGHPACLRSRQALQALSPLSITNFVAKLRKIAMVAAWTSDAVSLVSQSNLPCQGMAAPSVSSTRPFFAS